MKKVIVAMIFLMTTACGKRAEQPHPPRTEIRVELAKKHEMFLREAIDQSKEARASGNHPFGAVLAYDDGPTNIYIVARNTVNTDKDPTCHAEMNLVRSASQQLTAEQRAKATLYTSTEPCAMCAAAMFWSGIRTVYYAMPEKRLVSMAPDAPMMVLPAKELFSKATRPTNLFGPFLEEEAAEIHKGFWK